jgi:GNAT superfamily N-acetyltransferase
MTRLQVTYMELREPPPAPILRAGPESITLERLNPADYLAIYRKVGAPLRWDQRLQMSEQDLTTLLNSAALHIYVLRNHRGVALGFCELDRHAFPDVEVKNFGLVPEAQGQGLGPWLLAVALHEEWQTHPARIWLHTDTWDHPAAIGVYQRAGFKIDNVVEEESDPL